MVANANFSNSKDRNIGTLGQLVFMLYDCNVSFQHNPNVISQCLVNIVYLTVALWLDDGFTTDKRNIQP